MIGQESIIDSIVTISEVSSLNTKGLDDILSGEEIINWGEIIAERSDTLFFYIINVEGSNDSSNFVFTSIIGLIEISLVWTFVI